METWPGYMQVVAATGVFQGRDVCCLSRGNSGEAHDELIFLLEFGSKRNYAFPQT